MCPSLPAKVTGMVVFLSYNLPEGATMEAVAERCLTAKLTELLKPEGALAKQVAPLASLLPLSCLSLASLLPLSCLSCPSRSITARPTVQKHTAL
jgi:hypothetical protein